MCYRLTGLQGGRGGWHIWVCMWLAWLLHARVPRVRLLAARHPTLSLLFAMIMHPQRVLLGLRCPLPLAPTITTARRMGARPAAALSALWSRTAVLPLDV